MKILNVEGLCKSYPGFELREVSFSIDTGRIMGFIGRNGAGKSTTLKAIMNMVHADKGRVEVFGLNMTENERLIRQRIGYAGGAVDYYKKKSIGRLIGVAKRFYTHWDDTLCEKYTRLFSLDLNKTPSELSEGMKVKLNLLLALSHGAELLILDEPTSGLDPVSREELLEIFRYLRAQGVSILFSTHITSDLEKCADDICYIRDGSVIYTGSVKGFVGDESLENVMIRHEKEAFHEKLAL